MKEKEKKSTTRGLRRVSRPFRATVAVLGVYVVLVSIKHC